MNEDEFAELAAGRAVDALSPEDERRFQEALAAHPEWAARADEDAETAAALSEALTPVAPPPEMRERLLAAIDALPQSAAPAAAQPTTRSSDLSQAGSAPVGPVAPAAWRRRLFALAASLVLILGLGVGASIVIPQLTRPPAVSALDEIRSADDAQQATVELPAGGSATAHWSAAVGSVVLVADGLEDPGADRTYELWFVRGDDPIPAGTFRPDDGTATALLEGRMHTDDVIAVTVEQEGGSPDGKPTTDPIIVIPTA